MDIFRIALGAALAALGRRIFWLFVAGIGFIVGLQLSNGLLPDAPQGLNLIIAVFAGVVGAAVAVLLQRLGIGLAGFLGGAFVAFGLLDLFSVEVGSWVWIVYVVGGVLGAVLMSLVFEWALIVLSAIAGGVLITRALPLHQPWSGVVFLLILVAGIAFQGRALERGSKTSIPRSETAD